MEFCRDDQIIALRTKKKHLYVHALYMLTITYASAIIRSNFRHVTTAIILLNINK